MPTTLRAAILFALLLVLVAGIVPGRQIVDPKPSAAPAVREGKRVAPVTIDIPMSPPTWALLQRQLLDVNSRACRAFYDRYFDDRGYLLCVERWGGDDGPDDAIENCGDWPLLYALGGSEEVFRLYLKAWEGHLRQYTLAKTTEVPFAKDGMYYKEFPVMFDWLHHAEGLTPFFAQGLANPTDAALLRRARRFAGLYIDEDPGAKNYDPKHKIIRSLLNGSRGPMLRKATALDWAGDPVEAGRFNLLHGERNYKEVLAHFADYTDVVGDNPENLIATTLVLNAYLLTHDQKYRRWILEYVDAWRKRMSDNNGIIPSNIGLDGKIGSSAGGKWYGGTYGWGFTVTVPQTGKLAHRNSTYMGLVGFTNAYLLTGDVRYLDGWAKQIDIINSKSKQQDGKTVYPHMYGDKAWYAFTPERYSYGSREIYYLTARKADRKRIPSSGWLAYLEGNNAGYPERALRADLERIRLRAAAMSKDESTPDTRLSDNPLAYTPASVQSLVELTMGGLHPGKRGMMLHARLRYFDPQKKRPGLPDGVAALVEGITDTQTTVTLINTDPLKSRRVLVQSGAYAEHNIVSVSQGKKMAAVGEPWVTVEIGPGCGAKLTLTMKRHANVPTMAFPPGM